MGWPRGSSAGRDNATDSDACGSTPPSWGSDGADDGSRVELPLLDGMEGTDYINANYLRNKAGACRVIAAQGYGVGVGAKSPCRFAYSSSLVPTLFLS